MDLAEFQEDAVKKARRILARYDGVLIADCVGLGKTWIGKKLLEDFAYHRRQKAVVVCPASLRDMWQRELARATIAAQIVGHGGARPRQRFDAAPYGDADVILIDESHNFRNDKANRYLALDTLIQLNGGRGRDGERKKVILLSATPINNDLYDLANQIRLFTQGRPDYFREAGIGDLNAYFRRARRLVRNEDATAGVVLFNLLEEVMVRNTRPYIRAAYPNATIRGKPVAFPDRRLHTVAYDLGATYGGLYDEIVAAIDGLSLGPLQAGSVQEEVGHPRTSRSTSGRRAARRGWSASSRPGSSSGWSRASKRSGSACGGRWSSRRRTWTTCWTARSSRRGTFRRRCGSWPATRRTTAPPGSLAEELDAVAEAREYIDGLPRVDLNAVRPAQAPARRGSRRRDAPEAATSGPSHWPPSDGKLARAQGAAGRAT